LKKNRKLVLGFFCFVLTAFFCQSQTRSFPIQNGKLRNDLDADYNVVTNLKAISFLDNGSNVYINASNFLYLFEGLSKKLINIDGSYEFLVVSNARPYMVTTNGMKEVTLQGDTSFIRQYEPEAFISNLTVNGTLWVEMNQNIDTNDYSVMFSSLTNGSISTLKAENVILGNYRLDWNTMVNFSWSNTVPVNMTVTNDAYTSATELTVNEWTYCVRHNGKVKSGKVYFSVRDTQELGSKIIGNNPIEEIYAVDTEMLDRDIDIVTYGHKVQIITSGAGNWSFYGFSRGMKE